MISFNDFQTLLEGKKKEEKIAKRAKQIAKDVKKQVKAQKNIPPNTAVVSDYGGGEPGSDERNAAIKAMMADNKEYVRKLRERQRASQTGTQSVDGPGKP